ncbi:MAG: phage major capsid protein [Microbacteriaceae bacterium]|uniref:Major capsid protein n=1 Tax=Bordetella phage FP1 TaxID=1916125 RepID=A0A2D0W9L4_9CAUD|nr:major head protein [Bordetella phage FP1]APL99358.1 major capsid protein [Bordetella phage FP1]RQP10032.1 MAG: phage major capsid protein [Microbacteriaceae bacterium]
MSSVTLAESAKLAQDELVAGVIENIITVNRFFDVLPFDGIEGNSLAYNRENVLGDVINAGVGTTFSGAGAGKNPATFTRVNSNLTTIMGDAEVNGLIQATRSGDGNDQTAVQIASKAKSAGRQYQNQLINGTGTNNEFAGLLQLVAGGQTLTPQTNGQALSFEILDELMDRVVDKDGQVDYITMHARTLRSYKALLRNLGGASINEVVELPSGAEVPAYSGVPIFRNDYIPTNQTQGNVSTATTIFAGTLDDGSRTHGIAGLTATTAAGIQVVDVGESEDADEHIWRVKWYCGLALFSEKGLAAAPGITN